MKKPSFDTRQFRRPLAVAFACVAFSLGSLPAISVGLDGTAPVVGAEKDNVYRKAVLSVVAVRAKTELSDIVVNGFFVGDGTLIATTLPLESEPIAVEVFHAGVTHPAEVVLRDTRTRVLLLKVAGLKAPPLSLLGHGINLPLASQIFAVCESEDPLLRFVEARIAGREKNIRGMLLPVTLIRANFASRLDGIGAPLLTPAGHVAGMVVLGVPEEPDSAYALPAAVVKKFADDFMADGKIRRSFLGLSFEDGTTTPRILEVRENGPAALAGLKQGDIILRVGDRGIEQYQDVVDSIYFLTPGEPVVFEILRGLHRHSYSLTPRKKEEPQVETPPSGVVATPPPTPAPIPPPADATPPVEP